MNSLEMKGTWNIFKGKLKQKWANLTEDNVKYAEGKETELTGRIQKRSGKARGKQVPTAQQAEVSYVNSGR